jgi:hypothetical protein
MNVRYYLSSDLGTLNFWLGKHNHPMVLEDDLPFLGYVVEQDNTPLAMAFLRQVEGNKIALAESLVTNPDISPRLATKATKRVIEELVSCAKDLNVKCLVAMTNKRSVAKYILKHHKFSVIQDATLVLPLT